MCRPDRPGDLERRIGEIRCRDPSCSPLVQSGNNQAANRSGTDDKCPGASDRARPTHRMQRDRQRLSECSTRKVDPLGKKPGLFRAHRDELCKATLDMRSPCSAPEVARVAADVPTPRSTLRAVAARRGRMNRDGNTRAT